MTNRTARWRDSGTVWRAAALGVVTATTVAGCGMTVDTVPLPKPGVPGPTYTVHAEFKDALNLPTRAHVKIGGTDIGVVTAIGARNFVADITMRVRADITLPEGTTAELRQATPLGDMFVALTLPEDHGQQALRDGDTIGLDHTSVGASVEELMMSVSMLLNGGVLNQVARITTEMDSMFAGRGPQLSHLIVELTDVLGALNRRTDQIDGVLTGLNDLMGDLNSRKAELGRAADAFPPLIGVIADNNKAITALIAKVTVTMNALGDFTNTTGPQLTGLFNSVQKLMSGFTEMGDNLSGSLAALNVLYPDITNSFKGNELAAALTISSFDLPAITDPAGSRLPGTQDVPLFIGSLSQVLQRVIGRVEGKGK